MEGRPESEIREFNLKLEIKRRIRYIDITEAPTILRLPHHMRHHDQLAFDPEIISIGPYHWGKENLKLMEDRKWLYLTRLFERFPNFQDYQSYYTKAKSLVEAAKRCYRDDLGSTMANDDNFALMLLLDGSFILQRLGTQPKETDVEGKSLKPASITHVHWDLPPVDIDLIKFENQIPFFVLEQLYAHLSGLDEGHFLHDLVWKNLACVYMHIPHDLCWRNPRVDTDDCHDLLGFLHQCVHRGYKSSPTLTIPWIPTARGLLESGIRIKCIDSGYFLQVSFHNGTLMMSPLVIDRRTNCMLYNLLAWEQYHPEAGGLVRSYCIFIGCLVDTAADVLLLRQAKILINHIGSDEQAARLLNSLPKQLGDKEFSLSEVFDEINEYRDSSFPKYRARLMRDYCSHPWAIISVLAAFLLLVLTAGQTAYTALSYYHRN